MYAWNVILGWSCYDVWSILGVPRLPDMVVASTVGISRSYGGLLGLGERG